MTQEGAAPLEEQAKERRQRLLALKRRRDGQGGAQPLQGEHEALPQPIFRSYQPQDARLQQNLLSDSRPEDIGQQVREQLEAGAAPIVLEQLDVTALAPRKPDWDLKRDLGPKTARLERQTQRAIAELIRQRLNDKSHDLATAVNVGAGIYQA
ncbi:coiled-coil domain-containing protein 12 [Dendroctonus ponderosae]|uniref:Cwf18 pre-mRNA splicing factor n=1 Tax=Dendroctonus ponderosae TaxID=77166 RepID=U4UZ34_DENPD|nr:coiled-coil domain-containing protein 12 [Dendroctonus ponderosae]ERL95605.1 hypothetical protein D910_00031 [Dendroctonus ponderosae]KAH1003163.1 hypothetical protein HUJ05_011103 [Dendroctonus ponderosae]